MHNKHERDRTGEVATRPKSPLPRTRTRTRTPRPRIEIMTKVLHANILRIST